MPDASLAGIPAKPTRGQPVPAPAAFKVLYDGQCEICQACVSWLKTLGDGTQTICLPISEEVLSSLDSRLRMDDCLRQLHVVTPQGEILIGWDAVALLAQDTARAATIENKDNQDCRHSCPRRARWQSELALWPQRCCDLCFRDDRKIPYSIQKASLGTRRHYRPASGSEAAVRTLRRVPRH